MTRQAAEAADNVPNLPILSERDEQSTVGLLLVTGDRGLAGAFNSQILRAGTRAAAEHEAESRQRRLLRVGPPRRVLADLPRARASSAPTPASPTGPPTPTRARSPTTS